MISVRRALKKSPLIHLVGKEVKRSVGAVATELRRRAWKRSRAPVIAAYLARESEPKLHIGCGPMIMGGWLNTDIEPRTEHGVVYLNICEEMPFPDGKFQYIYSEHVLEHIELDQAFKHFKDCYRVLRPGGVLRVAMPDLKFLLDYGDQPGTSAVQQEFLEHMAQEFHPGFPFRSPAMLLNDFVRRWNHQFIYDRPLARQMMLHVGFASVTDCEVMQSEHAALAGLERHGSAIGDAFNRLQTMVLEAKKAAG